MKTILLVLLLAPIAVAQADKQPAPKVVRLMLCEQIHPPDAKPNTTTLSCHYEVTRKLDELQPIVLEIPDTFAMFAGRDFYLELLSDGSDRFNPQHQPEGSVVHLSPPCAKKPGKPGYRIEPLQQGPCNPELSQ